MFLLPTFFDIGVKEGEHMRFRMYRRRIRPNCKFYFVLLIVFTVLSGHLFFSRIYPNYTARVDIYMNNLGNKVINSALSEIMRNKSGDYFENIQTNSEGRVMSVEADTYKMNLFKAEYTDLLLEKLDNAGYIEIPLGSLLKEEMFSGFGPKMKIKVVSNGTVKTDFSEDFVSCGINQVKHKIYIKVSVSFSAISATMRRSRTVETEIPIADTVIPGTVPNYYGGIQAALPLK